MSPQNEMQNKALKRPVAPWPKMQNLADAAIQFARAYEKHGEGLPANCVGEIEDVTRTWEWLVTCATHYVEASAKARNRRGYVPNCHAAAVALGVRGEDTRVEDFLRAWFLLHTDERTEMRIAGDQK